MSFSPLENFRNYRHQPRFNMNATTDYQQSTPKTSEQKYDIQSEVRQDLKASQFLKMV